MSKAGRKLRVGMVGAGGIAGEHANYFKKFSDVDLVAACDVDAARLAKFGEKYEVKQLFDSWLPMIEEARLDAVSVCTPNGLHCRPTVEALGAGCHVLVEKPLAMNAAEGEKMLAAARKNRRHLMIAFQHRFDGRTKVIRRAFDEGIFGKILFVRVQALRRRGIPNWGVFGRKELQGGGPMIDIGVHALEMAHYAIGTPEPVAAVGQTWTYLGNKASDTMCMWPGWDYKTYTVEDLAIGHIRMKTGAVIHIEASFAAHIEKDCWNFQIMGEKGGAVFEPTAIFQDQAGAMLNCTPGFIPKIDKFEYKMRNFVDVCLYNKPCEAPAEHGLMVQKMLDGVYASSGKGGREVTIK
jgi:predicted dehydrogenase